MNEQRLSNHRSKKRRPNCKLRWGVNLEGHARVNAIMKAELSDHFAFYFYWEWLDTFPVVWGGRAPDGHVVAVLFTITWT